MALTAGLVLVAAAAVGLVLWMGRTPPPPAVAPAAPVADLTGPPREPANPTPVKGPDSTPLPDRKPDAAETTAGGKAVGVDGNRLTFTADGEDRTVTVPAGAAVRIDGKDGTLGEVRKGGTVTVTSRGDVVSKVEVINPGPPPPEVTLAGTLVGMDQDKLTLLADGKVKTFTIPAAARVMIDDKDGQLRDIKKDTALTITARADVVSKVEAKSPIAPPPEATTALGWVVSVDKDKLTMRVPPENQKTLTVPAAAKVTIDAKEGTLADIKKDSIVTVTSKDDVVVAVEAKSPPSQERTAAGKVTTAAKNKLTIQDEAGKEFSITVPADAKVIVDGKADNVEDIKADSTVTVTLKGDVASKVEAKSPAPPPPKLIVAAGKVVGVDKNRLSVHADDGDKTFTVPADAKVMIDDKDAAFADVRKNSTVSVTTKDDVVVTVAAKSPPPPAPAKAPFEAADAKRVQQDWADSLGAPVEREAALGGGVTMKLRLIPPGRFKMGSPKDEEGGSDSEGPQHEVEITKPFYLGVYPVTKGQFAAFVDAEKYKTEAESGGNGCMGYNAATRKFEHDPKYNWKNPGFAQTDDHPVVNVTWNDAQAFCAWLSKKEGKTYELPTEAEREYACRAGTTTRFWCGGDDASLQGNANIADASLKNKLDADVAKIGNWTFQSWDDGYPFTSPVGMLKANPWGLYDMSGNVWQWCADGYGPYDEKDIKDPKGKESSNSRVLRGGCWANDPGDCRSAGRNNGVPGLRDYAFGFRVVLRSAPRTP